MENEYVRQDTFEATMREIRALMAASEARHEKLAAEIKADSENFKSEICGEIKTINARIDGINLRLEDIKNFQNQSLAKWGLLIAICVGFVQVIVALALK